MIDQVIPPLDRLSQRPHFTAPEDLVFVNETGASSKGRRASGP
jgi:hypothetical protein